MEALETLWLRYNKITYVSPDIGALRRLKMLDLRENKIQHLPREIGVLKNLSILLLSSNHLKALPNGMLLASKLDGHLCTIAESFENSLYYYFTRKDRLYCRSWVYKYVGYNFGMQVNPKGFKFLGTLVEIFQGESPLVKHFLIFKFLQHG